MDWISVIIVLLIVGIVADGLRRVRKSRREGLQLSRRVHELDGEDSIKVSSSEFPSGGARVAARRDPNEASNLNEDVRKSYESSKITVGAPKRNPEQVSLNLEEVVPMLMDSLDSTSPDSTSQESDAQDEIGFDDEDEPRLGDMQEIEKWDEPDISVTSAKTSTSVKDKPANTGKYKDTKDKNEGTGKSPSEVLVVSVMARAGERFQGEDLLQALMELNMKFGEMDIFHRHEEASGEGEVYFSLANIVVPGTFNLAEIQEFSTPGVSLFMQLPLRVESHSLRAFDIFATTARSLATRLSGELKDENRSVMTSQTFEHYRQRVIEFERQKKLQHS